MKISSCIAMGVLAMLVAVATGQVAPVQTGQALDANPQVGSGGFNSTAQSVGGVNSQLYVTGQVTGLARFHGPVPYYAPNQLNIPVPSADQSTFISQSASLSEALRQQAYQTRPFYDKSNTVGVRAAALTPGVTNVYVPPRAPTLATPLSQQLFQDATAGYSAVNPLASTPGANYVPSMPLQTQAPPQSATPGTLFGRVSSRESSLLAKQLQELMQPEGQAVLPAEQGLNPEVQGGYVPPAPGEYRVPPQNPEPAVQNEVFLSPTGIASVPGLPQRNQDIYLDLLATIANQRRKNPSYVQKPQAEAAPVAPAPTPAPERLKAQLRINEAGNVEIGPPVVEQSGTTIVVHGLAGVSPDMFNTYMAKADKMLKAGQYYDAATKYEEAATIDPSNPLARLGLALAYFGAGEPLSAAAYMHRAVQMFPPLIETKIDIPAMMDVDNFRSQLKKLDERQKSSAAKGAEEMLEYLSMFANKNIGNTEAAAAMAKKLQNSQDPVYRQSAIFVLTGKRPLAATSAPAAAAK